MTTLISAHRLFVVLILSLYSSLISASEPKSADDYIINSISEYIVYTSHLNIYNNQENTSSLYKETNCPKIVYSEKQSISRSVLNLNENISPKKPVGRSVGHFFLGALVGAASAGIVMVLTEGGKVIPSDPNSGTTHYENTGAWLIGGAVGGGLLFALTLK